MGTRRVSRFLIHIIMPIVPVSNRGLQLLNVSGLNLLGVLGVAAKLGEMHHAAGARRSDE